MFKIFPSLNDIQRQVDTVISKTSPHSDNLGTQISVGGNGKLKVYLTQKVRIVQSVGKGVLKTSTEDWIHMSITKPQKAIYEVIRYITELGVTGENPYQWVMDELVREEARRKEDRNREALDYARHLENPTVQVK